MLRPTWFLPSEAGESNRDALRAEILSLAESTKAAGNASVQASGPVVSLVDSDDDDDAAAVGGRAAASCARPSPLRLGGAAELPLTLSDDD